MRERLQLRRSGRAQGRLDAPLSFVPQGGPDPQCALSFKREPHRRLGVFLDHLERLGALDSTTFLLTSDHGSEGADPACS